MKQNLKILVVEDDKAIRNLLSTALKTYNYQALLASTGKEALQLMMSQTPDLIILDLGLPDLDGRQIIREVRGWSVCPIIVVSARSDDQDKVEALDEGADDYLTKPFSVDELMARIRVAVRKIERIQPASEKTVFVNGGLRIDYDSCEVTVDGRNVHLTPMEFKLLCLLAHNMGKVLTHNYILQQVWVNALESDIPSLRVFMATLRKKIESDTSAPKYIQTHVGIGYRMIKVEKEMDGLNSLK